MSTQSSESSFAIVAATVPNLPGASLTVAAARAGHLGLVDAQYLSLDTAAAADLAAQLSAGAPAGWGLRVDAMQLPALLDSPFPSAAGFSTLLIAGDADKVGAKTMRALRKAAPGLSVWLEVTSEADLASVKAIAPEAIVAKGSESGGRVGDETSFILLQRLLSRTDLPCFVQGGVGADTIAAFRVAGAAGVILDWQLTLFEAAGAPEDMTRILSRMDGSETRVLAVDSATGYRIFWRADHKPGQALEAVSHSAPEKLGAEIAGRLAADPAAGPWLTGQDAALAAGLLRRYGRLGAALRRLEMRSRSQIEIAASLAPLSPEAPLARAHGTRFPIVQGPMTRVSDRAEFALAVAENGALPFLALALMRGQEAQELVRETKERLGDKPWGVGILGFVDDALREEQLAIILAAKPDYALIAGGRPEQALALEKAGIPTYLHVPSPGLLTAFLQQGARRFIFEGRECGGHVGPRTSAILWQQALDSLRDFYGDKPMDCDLLFAGGLHDAASAAMVSVLAADASQQGARIGALMGSAYILTQEAVAAGAVVPKYQELVLGMSGTVLLESGVGHATRVVQSPIAEEFAREKARMIGEGLDPDTIRDKLENLSIGRSRVAAKGIDRNPDFGTREGVEKYIVVSPEDQLASGVYMIGQVAGLHHADLSMAALHLDVSEASTDMLRSAAKALGPETEVQEPSEGLRIAITGMSTILPKAPELSQYWENILDKVDAIDEVPERRWDWRRYFDADRDAADKAYSKWGGFVDEIAFDPIRYGIPPNSVAQIEPLQMLALEMVRKALEDAGFKDGVIPDPDLRRRTCVVIGVGGGAAPMGQQYAVRSSLSALLGELPDVARDKLPEWTEDSFPGILLNVIAGRVANRFDLGGVNFTVDAACGSSLAAVLAGVREMETGAADMAIVAGVDAFMSPFDFIAFSKTRALSPRGRCRTFDESADGIAISEGLVSLVLRPLPAAEAAGDRIYAVLRGVAGASDGRDLSLTAPRPEGQQETLRRAYAHAGISPASVELVEAHGTGTVVGDRTEIESLSAVYSEASENKQFCGVGSVKSMIGHTKAAAGCAGMVKMALALHHKVMPPTLNVESPSPTANFPESPFYVLGAARPWLKTSDAPRRAGVSAFGFGGTNFHAVLEEYRGGYLPSHQEPFRKHWSHELLLFSAADNEALSQALARAAEALGSTHGDTPLHDIAASLSKRYDASAPARFALVSGSHADAAARLARAAGTLGAGGDLREVDPLGAFAATGTPLTKDQVAFLFSGQGSQYPDMAAGLAMHFPQVRASLERAGRELEGKLDAPLSEVIFPRPAFSEEESKAHAARLKQTDRAQPAIGAVSLAILSLLRDLGADAGAYAGHSFGELTALCAAGAMDDAALVRLAHARGHAIIREGGDDLGCMTAVSADAPTIEAATSGLEGLTIANLNAPSQTVLAGSDVALAAAEEKLAAAGIRTRRLPVHCAFHSDFVAPARDRLAEAIAATPLAAPAAPVFSNETAAPYPADPAAISEQLTRHLTSPVNFQGEVTAMHEAGARLFIEVGPNAVLSRLAGQILEGKTHLAVATDINGRDTMQQLLSALGAMSTAGLPLALSKLFARRAKDDLDVVNWTAPKSNAPAHKMIWMLDPGGARPKDGARPRIGFSARIEDDVPLAAKHEASMTQTPPAASAASPASSAVPEQPGPVAAVTPPAAQPTVPLPQAAEIMQRHHELVGRLLDTHAETMRLFLAAQSASSGSTPILAAPAASSLQTTPQMAVPVQQPAPVAAPETAAAVAPIATPEPAAPAAAQVTAGEAMPTRESVTAKLLELLADRTGYPADMLAPDLNLEADLGIDSIKRVEILASLRLAFLADAGEAAHEKMGPVAKEKTIDGIVARFMDVAEAVSGPAPVASPVAEAAPVAPAMPSRESVTAKLLELLADRTGYPADMLAPDLNLEADLGIDSIKRIEILASLRLAFLADAGEAAHEKMGPVAKEKTIDGIVARFMDVAEAVTCKSGSVVPLSAPKETEAPMPSGDARYVMVPVKATVPVPQAWVTKGGRYLLTRDRQGVADALAVRIEAAGGKTLCLDPDALKDSDSITRVIGDISEIAGIFHCADLQSATGSGLDADGSIAAIRGGTRTLYALLTSLGAVISQRCGLRVVAVTAMGGQFGFGAEAPADPTQAGAPGVLKTLAKEWTDAHVRAVDLEPGLPASAVAEILFDEAGRGDDHVEIGWRAGQRWHLAAERRAVTLPETPVGAGFLDDGATVLVTGGARGITATCVLWLAERYKARFVILGSSPLPEGAESPETAVITDPVKLRAALAQMPAKGGGRRAIAEIESEHRAILKTREIRNTFARIKAFGGQVEYHACDVRDRAALKAVIDDVYARHGQIDGVIHGAGIIEDRLIVDKTLDSYDRVMTTKAHSAFYLAEALRPDALRFLAFFTSVAGRFGNRGQSDYGAANEIVSKFARTLDAVWPGRVVALSWGPWDSGGMVSDEIKKQFTALGIEAIQPDLGRRALEAELSSERDRVPEVVWGNGPWAWDFDGLSRSDKDIRAAE
ncbi:polyketide-type polyunsaturated fatty acid synthase PfaA [Roseivivax lentus]|uniref:Polyketide-type polyunsaturated fatty acid synthase PfaA n=1 Tax=Roseivivax lentus TaxID=633194 RepID=A0A1N7PY74_9RHOB|nr:type I polyketide synthase [Roseivivax lentus]SIT15317.1 polyketide-type polyunsaturated fatty acid synthase PfaA [Roseivivax lentus]